MKRRFDVYDLLVLLGFIVLIVLTELILSKIWDISYWMWYLKNGFMINWLMSLFALIAGDLNKNTMLISARPLEYLAAHFKLLSEMYLWIATLGVVKNKEEPPVTSYSIDTILSLFVEIIFGLLIILWLIAVAPIQYFTFFICGAPARKIVCSEERLDENPVEWWRTSVTQNPVSLTAGFGGMLLGIINIVF